MGEFSATVSKFCREEIEREQAVLQLAAQKLYNGVRTTVNEGGRLPIKDGVLRRSIVASSDGMPPVRPELETKNENFPDLGSTSLSIIGSMELGQTIWIGVTAAHGPRQNYGFVGVDSLGRSYNQAGFGFIEDQAMRWQQTVTEAENEVSSRFHQGTSAT